MTLVLDEKARSAIPRLTQWFTKITELPKFNEYFGKTWLCQKEFVPDFDLLCEQNKKFEESKKPKPQEKKE